MLSVKRRPFSLGLNVLSQMILKSEHISMASRQKGPTRHAYAWQIGPFWQDTLDLKMKSMGAWSSN